MKESILNDGIKDVAHETPRDSIDIETKHERNKIVTVFIVILWSLFTLSIVIGQIFALSGVKVQTMFVDLTYCLLWGASLLTVARTGGDQIMSIIKQYSGRFGGRF